MEDPDRRHILLFVTLEQEATLRWLFRERNWPCFIKVLTSEIVKDLGKAGFSELLFQDSYFEQEISNSEKEVKTEFANGRNETSQLAGLSKEQTNSNPESQFRMNEPRLIKTHAGLINLDNGSDSLIPPWNGTFQINERTPIGNAGTSRISLISALDIQEPSQASGKPEVNTDVVYSNVISALDMQSADQQKHSKSVLTGFRNNEIPQDTPRNQQLVIGHSSNSLSMSSRGFQSKHTRLTTEAVDSCSSTLDMPKDDLSKNMQTNELQFQSDIQERLVNLKSVFNNEFVSPGFDIEDGSNASSELSQPLDYRVPLSVTANKSYSTRPSLESGILQHSALESVTDLQSEQDWVVVKTEVTDYDESYSDLSVNDMRPYDTLIEKSSKNNCSSQSSAVPVSGVVNPHSNLDGMSSNLLAALAGSVHSTKEECPEKINLEKGKCSSSISQIPVGNKQLSADIAQAVLHPDLTDRSRAVLLALTKYVNAKSDPFTVENSPDISTNTGHSEMPLRIAPKRKLDHPEQPVTATFVMAMDDYKNNVKDIAVARFVQKSDQMVDKTPQVEKTGMRKQPIKCVDCPKLFWNRTALWKHRNEVKHKLPAVKPPTRLAHQIFTPEELVAWGYCKCHLCEKSYPEAKSLRKHIKDVHKTLVAHYSCPICDEQFTKHDDLLQHKLDKQHNDNKSALENIPCDICGRLMSNYGSLVQHQRYACGKSEEENESLRVHPCEVCGKMFRSVGFVKAHYRHVHVNEPEVCDICGTVCKNKSALHAHRLRHDKSNKKFSCEECGKLFYGKSILKTHMRIHTKDKPFKCPLCDYVSGVKHNVPKHAKAVHKTTVTAIDLTKQPSSVSTPVGLELSGVEN